MEKPLASAVLHSLHSFPPFASTSALPAVTRVMKPQTRPNPLAYDFFLPKPRNSKGKEREHDKMDHECALALLGVCRDWSYAVKHPIWCTERARLLMMSEVIPRRDGMHSSRATIQSTRFSARSRFVRTSVPLKYHQRHASNVTERPPLPPKPPEPADVIKQLAEPPQPSEERYDSVQLETELSVLLISSDELAEPPQPSEESEDSARLYFPLNTVEKEIETKLSVPLISSDELAEQPQPSEESEESARFEPELSMPSLSSDEPPPKKNHTPLPSSPTPYSEVDKAFIDAKEATLRKFRDFAECPVDKFDAEGAWAAVIALVRDRATKDIPIDIYMDFLERFVSSLEKHYRAPFNLEQAHFWGARVKGLLEAVGPNLHAFSGPAILRQCLLSRTEALLGKTGSSASFLHDLVSSGFMPSRSNLQVLEAYNNLFLSILAHKGPEEVIRFLPTQWIQLGPHLSNENNVRFGAGKIFKTLKAVLNVVKNIAHVADILVSSDSKVAGSVGEVFVRLLCQMRQGERAHAVIQSMQRHSLVVPSEVMLKCVRTLAQMKDFARANVLFDKVPRGMFAMYRSTGIYLASMQGDIDTAKRFFEMRLPADETHPRLADKAMIMTAYTKNSSMTQAVELFNEFFPKRHLTNKRENSPQEIHYSIIISGFARLNDLEGMNVWLGEMNAAKIVPQVHLFSNILRSFAVLGDMQAVHEVLTKMRAANVSPNIMTYTTIMTLLARRKDPVGAEKIFKQAVAEGLLPDRQMVTTLMNAHVEAGSWSGVIRIFDYLQSSPLKNMSLTIEVYNTLFKAYVLIGTPFRIVSRLFERLVKIGMVPDRYTYALLVQSACDANLMDVALNILQELDQMESDKAARVKDTKFSGEPHKLLSIYILSIAMTGFLRNNLKARAKAVYEDIRTRGYQPTAATFGAIIKAYGIAGTEENFEIAERFIQDLVVDESQSQIWIRPSNGTLSPLENVYGPLIAAYARGRRRDDVERVFQDYLDKGGHPSLPILTPILDVYRRTAAIDSAQDLWPRLFALGKQVTSPGDLFQKSDSTPRRLQPDVMCAPLSIYIDALSTAGRHLEIAAVWKEYRNEGFVFNSHNWNHLIVALVRAGQPERAFEVVEHVIHPYQIKAARMSSTRDKNPTSPLLFNEREDGSIEPGPPSLSEAPMHNTRQRSNRVSSNKAHIRNAMDYVENEELAADFAHPLHILHNIAPSWNTWEVHSLPLMELSRVLKILRSGRLVLPLEPYSKRVNRSEESPSAAQDASDMLARIIKNYPIAVRKVEKRNSRT